jgi:cell division protein FtsA
MARVFSDRIVVSIDIGTTKICVLVAHHLDNGRVDIIGIGKAPSEGLKKGVVTDVAKTIHSIKTAIREAELMSGIDIESAYVGISGGHISAVNSHGIVRIKKGEVRQTDIDAVLEAARAIPIPEGQQILHALPQYFTIDGTQQVQFPLGMHGIRLELTAHIIMGSIASAHNLVKCCEMAGVKVKDIILEQLASAQAVLSPDERELGIALLDIGGGTSDLALYQHGTIRHTMVLPVAGNHFTNDVAIGLRTTLKDAERIKLLYGSACTDLLRNDEIIEVAMTHGDQKHTVLTSELSEILQARAQEIFRLIHQEIGQRKLHHLMPSGLVITGGGSLLGSMKELAERTFHIPVRIGYPRLEFDLPSSISNPMYATGYGLIMYALRKNELNSSEKPIDSTSGRIFGRMKAWVSDFF